jgi:DNA-binding transcriptional LysR family regulator
VTLPLEHPELYIEELRRDPLVVCLRQDNPLARNHRVQASDLQGNLSILHHPKRHPRAHAKLLRHLADAGVEVADYSHASHPSEMQMLVKEGHGLTLIRDGTPLDDELTTRPIAGVDWTIDTAIAYHKLRHPKTIPILIKKLKKQLDRVSREGRSPAAPQVLQHSESDGKRPSRGVQNPPAQLKLSR